MKHVKLQHNDTCLSYVGKRMGLNYGTYNMTGHDFFEKHKQCLVQVNEYNVQGISLAIGDIIIAKTKQPKIVVKSLEIDEVGRTFLREYHKGYHFFLCEGDFVSDCYGGMMNGICIRKTEDLKLIDNEYDYFILGPQFIIA